MKHVFCVWLLVAVWLGVMNLAALERKDLVIERPYLSVTDPQWTSRWAKVDTDGDVLVLVWSDLDNKTYAYQFAAQQEPDHPRDSDSHFCTNAKNAPHKCTCKKEPGQDGSGCDANAAEDKKCSEWCHRNHCHCFHPQCDS